MPEIVEKGFLYIAQPPLFKVGKGKSGKYLKDEIEYNEWILKKICDQKEITADQDNKKISGHRLYLFICDLSEYFTQSEKLSKRGIEPNLVELLIKEGVEDKNYLQDQSKMSALRDLLIKEGYRVDDLIWNEERGIYELMILGHDGTEDKEIISGPMAESFTPIKVGRGLIYSSDYQKCLIAGKSIAKHDAPPFKIYTKDKEEPAASVKDKRKLLELLFKEGKKGINVQRYKGLGEMNPDQLWHTTMNPEKRTLLQVKIEDMVDTDEIFTILMGEEVEPRREFIQNNALEVSVLDI
jgi:DNA gyrase subunit B